MAPERGNEAVATDGWERLLAAAVSAARVAGERLREERRRPGGPRGLAGWAPIDVELEAACRASLLEALPEASFRGRESGRVGAGALCWLVDPHDGAAAWLRGATTSAVSIALLQHGRPVLGVVHSPFAPDEGGDLFAWAEGLPLTRNGRAIVGSTPPQGLCDDAVVLTAGAESFRVAEPAGPPRFVAQEVASVAYRLARVAAGEAVAALAVEEPRPWQCAAGDALLRAVGGVLIDDAGEPVRYDASAWRARRVAGGSLPVVRTLLRRVP